MLQTTTTIMSLQVTLFLMILAGTFGKKLGIITPGFESGLSKFLMNLILPCSVLSAFSKQMDDQIWRQSIEVLVAGVCVHIAYILIGLIVSRGQLPDRKPVLQYAVLSPNTNFMGMPVIGGILGDIGILLLSIALFPVRVFVMTVGISYFVYGQSKRWYINLLKNPSVWAVFIGIAMMALHLQYPKPLSQVLSYFSSCTTPLSMILIGGVVSQLNMEMVKNLSVWKFCILRLLLIPALFFTILYFIPMDTTARTLTVLMSALPAGALTVIYTREYHRDETFAAACVIFSTALSIFTIPLVYMLCLNFR